jgi:Large eukaryotic DNA virus major capsid protein.
MDPVKYLIWYVKFRDKTTEEPIDITYWNSHGYNIRDSNGDFVQIKQILNNIEFDMNGIQREHARSETYFTNVTSHAKLASSLNYGEYFYSFALFPLIYQPTGTANFTEIGDSEIVLTLSDQIVTKLENNSNLEMITETWSFSVNILRIFSGLAGLAFYK